jgi:hypothetical protein
MVQKITLSALATLLTKGFASADKKFAALTDDIADLRKDMATKDDVRGIVREELKPIETRLAAVEGKVAGIDRRLDAEAIKRDDEKIPVRVDKLEKKVFGTHR